MVERQEIYCHNCGKYVQFDIDMSLNGNHVLKCPECGHEHCRVVKDGIITGDRWDSRNPNTYTVSSNGITVSYASTFTMYVSPNSSQTQASSQNYVASSWAAQDNQTSVFLYGSWMNTVTVS